MNKSVVISLGSGDLFEGFPRVTAQLRSASDAFPEQCIGSLPAAPELVELYRNWQLIYRSLCARVQILSRSRDIEEQDLEMGEGFVTNVSEMSFEDLCQQLQTGLNDWLKAESFRNIEQQIRSQLQPTEEIQVIFETDDEFLRRLPWQRWNFFQDYPKAEMALSSPEYKRQNAALAEKTSDKVRILAILANTQGIDLESEQKFLATLTEARTKFLINPTRQEFNEQLWDAEGWDILFFAGHSQTEGETGRIYLNENANHNSLTLEQLEEALKTAIDHGLKLAIFNSCDGLGLAQTLEKLNIPVAIVLREPVPNRVAQIFFKHFLEAFAIAKLSLHLSVKQARRKLQGLEDEFPGASWLPAICQNPAVDPPTWIRLGGIPSCPYRGLSAFREEDVALFFGRAQFTQALWTAVKQKPLVVVVGASGSGKSSVVLAGLIPKLKANSSSPSVVVSFRPGTNPFGALALALSPLWPYEQPQKLEKELQQGEHFLFNFMEKLVQQDPKTRYILVIDQFEELFTLCSEAEYQPFLASLLHAVHSASGFTLVLTLRSDFYGFLLANRSWSDALQSAVFNLGPMSREELQAAIEEPAALLAIGIEQGLTDKLIQETEGHAGRLPLLEFTLTELWSKQQEGWLTDQAYEALGGMKEILANYAETIYTQLNPEEQEKAQQIFMQLVTLEEDREATRRLATREEVKPENWSLVSRLAASRLVVTSRAQASGEETLEIVHESLLRSWGRLEQWIQVDGAFRLWQEQLRTARRTWEDSGQAQGALLRGKPLAEAEEWLQQRKTQISEKGQAFIQLSLEHRERNIQEKERYEHTIQREQRRRIISRSFLGLTSAAFVLSAGLGATVFWQSRQATLNQIQALVTSSDDLFSQHKRLEALVQSIRAKRLLHGREPERQVYASLNGMGERNRSAAASSPDDNQIVTQNQKSDLLTWNPEGTLSDNLFALKERLEDSVQSIRIEGWLKELAGSDPQTEREVSASLLQSLSGIEESNRLQGSDIAAFSPDGNQIATNNEKNDLLIWNRDGTLVRTISGHKAALRSVAFSPENQQMATASKDGTAKIWTMGGKLVSTLKGHKSGLRDVAFSRKTPTTGFAQTIATASDDGTIKLWHADGTVLQTLSAGGAPVSGVAFSPDGQLLAAASYVKTIKLWRYDGKKAVPLKPLTGHRSFIMSVAFSPDGKMLATGSQDATIKLWRRNASGEFDPKSYKTLAGHRSTVSKVLFSPNGKTLASASWDKTVKLWNLDGVLQRTFEGHTEHVLGLAFSPDGQILASAGGVDGTTRLWNLRKPKGLTLRDHKNVVLQAVFSPDNQRIASGSDDKTVKLWKPDGTVVQTLTGHSAGVLGVAFSQDSQTLATASRDGTVNLWQLDPKIDQYNLAKTLNSQNGEVWKVAISPDGQIASTGRDGTLKLWSKTGQLLKTLTGHRAEVRSVSFSPNGQLMATSSFDKTVKIWDKDGVLLRTLENTDGVVAVAFSPDGQSLASSGYDNAIKLWNIDGKLLHTFEGHRSEVRGIAFSPDGKILASASADKTIKLWQLDGTEMATLKGHNNAVWSVAFSPNSKQLVSASEDGTVKLWDADLALHPESLLARSCDWAHDFLQNNPELDKHVSEVSPEEARHLCD
jgi:WD40 repeat protein/energy-coupling factor transporter ATP-binding protein EcfA2